jgi:uncharacterized protein (DUF2147 family)
MKTPVMARCAGALALLLVALPALAQPTPVGTWRTIDDETGEPRSLVRIYEQDGRLQGDIVTLLPEDRVCSPCAERFEGRDLKGTTIVTGLRRRGSRNEWSGGRITDPKNGRTYNHTVSMDGPNRLRLRGYVLGIRALGRTQTWERVQ